MTDNAVWTVRVEYTEEGAEFYGEAFHTYTVGNEDEATKMVAEFETDHTLTAKAEAFHETYSEWYEAHFAEESEKLITKSRRQLGNPGDRYWDYDLRLVEVLPADQDGAHVSGVPVRYGSPLGMVVWFHLGYVGREGKSYMDLSRLTRYDNRVDARGPQAEQHNQDRNERMDRR